MTPCVTQMDPRLKIVAVAVLGATVALVALLRVERVTVAAQARELAVLTARYDRLARRAARAQPSAPRAPRGGGHPRCGSWAGCVDRVKAAGDAVRSARGGTGAFSTFGRTSVMNGVFGALLLPTLAHVARPKILEIGLGCGMPDGPGESADVWRALFPAGARRDRARRRFNVS